MKNKKSKKIRKIFLIILLFFTYWSIIEPHIIKIKKYSISSDLIPAEFDDYKIAFVSDLHIGKFTKIETINTIVNKLNRKEIDLLILGGDYVYNYGGDISEIFKPFKIIDVNDGVVAVTGNHDNWEEYGQIINAIENSTITLMNNKTIQISKESNSIEVSGVTDYWNSDFSDSNISSSTDNYRILISHNPDYLIDTTKSYDLGLSGHTHGGGVTLFGLWAPYIPVRHKDYWKGHYSLEEKDIVVSKGIGLVGLPIRFFATPEITFISLKAASK